MSTPRTEAGRRLIASFPSNAADAASPEFIRHMADAILAIEAEARAQGAAEGLAALYADLPDEHEPGRFR